MSGVIRQDSRWGKHLQEPLTAEWLWLPDLVCPFHRQHRRVIYKSISGVRSIVRTVEEEDFERLARIRRCPTQFQAFVEGTNVHVHTIGITLFATAIHIQATGYRSAQPQWSDMELRAIELSDALAKRCPRLAHTLGLLLRAAT